MSQNAKILRFLTGGNNRTLTSRLARSRYGIRNLRARVAELRSEGFNIVTRMRTQRDGVRRASYTLGE